MDLITRWYMRDGVLVRRGVVPSSSQFSTFAVGTVEPIGSFDAGIRNVGCRVPYANLTPYQGNVTIAAGQTVSGLDIFGNVTFTGQGALRDCRIRGAVAALGTGSTIARGRTSDPLTTESGLIMGSGSNLRGSLIEWCTLDPTGYESSWQDGIRGGNFTMDYCEIMRTVDGGGFIQVGNGVIRRSRISRGFFTAYQNSAAGTKYAGFPNQGDFTTHSDGIQIHQLGGWVIEGNSIGGVHTDVTSASMLANRDPGIASQKLVIERIDTATDYYNSAIIVNSTSPNITSARIEKNWIQGGMAGINLAGDSRDPLVGVQVLNNRFKRPHPGYFILKTAANTSTISGNVYDDSGAAVPIQG